MARPRSLRRRSTSERVPRLVLAIAAAALGYGAVTHSLAMVIQKRSLHTAHSLAPNNGYITGLLSAELSSPDSNAEERAQADHLARLALQQDPAAEDGVVALGLNAQIGGDTTSARRRFAYAEALSRRNLQTQLWAISDAIERDNIPNVLRHYDIALRTSPEAASLLFPVLASAVGDPVIRAALTQTLAHRPSWADRFIEYAVTDGTDQKAVALLFQTLSQRGFSIPDRESSTLIRNLIKANEFEEAWAYYAASRPGVTRSKSRDPDFRNITDAPSPFDWMPVNDGSISASIQPRDNGGGILTFTAPPSIGGTIVKQTELLPPGEYILEGQSESLADPIETRPYWSLGCLNGPSLGRVEVGGSNAEKGYFSGSFTVPAGCPIQILTFSIQPSTRISGSSGEIDRAMLQPAE